MSDVHNQVLRAGLEAVRRQLPEVDADAAIRRAEIQQYLDSDARVPWSKIVELLAQIRVAVGGREAMIEFGRATNRASEAIREHPFKPLARGLLTPRRLYSLAFRLRHRSNYPFLRLEYAELKSRQIELTITIPAPLAPSLAYFEVLTGQLETLPCLLGRGPAQVEAEISEREGHWRVTLARRETWWTRILEALRGGQRGLREDIGLELDALERQHEQLRQAYAELGERSTALQLEVERRHELERLLLHQQRLELVGHMTAGIAHDFNNLLQVIGGARDLLELGLAPQANTAAAEPLADIDQALTSARDLTRQLLGFSRATAKPVGAVELAAALHKIERLVRRVLPRTITLECSSTSTALWLPLEPVELEQLLINLIINARDAMPEGGTIRLRATLDERGADRRARIEVEDTGVGMDAELRARIFEPFFTTKPSAKGTGLGLAIVFGLVERCAGRIEVTSTPGGGSVFVLELPVVAGVG